MQPRLNSQSERHCLHSRPCRGPYKYREDVAFREAICDLNAAEAGRLVGVYIRCARQHGAECEFGETARGRANVLISHIIRSEFDLLPAWLRL
jgi:hypothetical protein